MRKPTKEAKYGVNMRSQPMLSDVTFSTIAAATCALFTQIFWLIFLQKICLNMSKQAQRFQETTFADFKGQLCQLETDHFELEFSINRGL